MFLEMGSLAEADAQRLVTATTSYLETAIAAGEYHGWLATPVGGTMIAAGAGVQVRPQLPRPDPSGHGILTGRQGMINVYVEPAFRRRGLARLLVETALAWANDQQLAGIVLHASTFGRPLYEALGFVPTSEMRYAGREQGKR